MPVTDTNLSGQPFIKLEDLLLPSPLPAILALLIVLGTLYLSQRGARWLRPSVAGPAEDAAAFVLTTGLIGAFVHALAWAGYASISTLRIGGLAIAALGILQLSRLRLSWSKGFLHEHFRNASLPRRCALVLVILTVVALFASALGPPTDADSLDYHLGVPLDWLRHGGAYPRPDWLHARLASGLGECLNMLGLATGTDRLGALFQLAGLVVALLGVAAFATTHADQLFAALLVVACPAIPTLITAQKPQLLPAAALTVALVIIVQRFKTLNPASALLVFGCAAFAMATKHSFLLSGAVVVLFGLIAAIRAHRLGFCIIVLGSCMAVFALPVFARNFAFYGDPISPLLERWRPNHDPAIMAFAEQLRSWSGQLSVRRLARLPWDLAVTLRPGTFHDVLGLGVVGFLLALRAPGPTRKLLLASLAAFVLIIVFGQFTPRFFLEPYLWCAAAVAAAPWRPLKSLLLTALTAQAVLVAGVAVYLGILLFPGALTRTARDHVMSLMAAGYDGAKWLDATLPPDAIVLEDFRYRALLPRPFVAGDRFAAGDRSLLVNQSNLKEHLTEFVRERRVTVLVTWYPIDNPNYQWLATQYGTPLAGPVQIREAARSPFNRGRSSGLIAVRLNLDVLDRR
jgi:Protein of unknown function (DUF1420)